MGTRISRPPTKAVLLSLLLAAASGCGDEEPGGAKGNDGEPGPAADGTIIPQPLAYAEFPVDSATILRWVSTADSAQARQHAWNLWAGLTAMTTQTSNGAALPVYETWLSRYEVYNPGIASEKQALATRGRPVDRGFHSPVQFHHPGIFQAGSGAGDERVVAGVKYNNASALHVWTHNYTDSATLDSLNTRFASSNTPIADRNIIPFPDSAIATKPVYWIVNQTGLTIMPYWAGPTATTTDSTPTPSTWTQFVAIDPTNQAAADSVVQVQEYGQTYTAQVIGLNQFYSFALTQDEVNDIVNPDNNQALDTEIANDSIDVMVDGKQSLQPVTVGDFGVLVAMHVSTKEIGNWTWQTFWWSRDPANDPLAKDQPASVVGPFKHFAMQQAYWMTVPNTSPVQNQVTFNPYLETAFADSGVVSNCMSCHRMANWPGTSAGYHFYGDIDPGNAALFGDNSTKLDFLWSVQAGASTAQAGLLRRIRSGSRAQPPASGQDTGQSAQSAPTPSGR